MELDNLLLLRGLLKSWFCSFSRFKSRSQAQSMKLGANLILIAIHKWINKWLFDLYFVVDYSYATASLSDGLRNCVNKTARDFQRKAGTFVAI